MICSVKTLTAATTIAFASISVAHADSSLLFPYVVSSDTAYTFVSLYQNPYAPRNAEQQTDKISTIFEIGSFYKSLNPDEEAPGGHSSYYEVEAPGTLFQWEAGGRFDLASDFGDNLSLPTETMRDNSYGFMTVQYSNDRKSPGGGQMYGEALVVDTATGMIMSYPALHIHSPEGDFKQLGATEFATSWFPNSIAGTSWYVLPLNFLDNTWWWPVENDIEISTNSDSPGAFGRNGNYHESEVVNKKINGFDIIRLSDLTRDSQNFSMGGWATFKTSEPALVWKIQQSYEMGFAAATMSPVPIVQ